MENSDQFITAHLKPGPNYHAPDGSEIRLLPEISRGGLAHCTLPLRAISKAVCHRSVEEIWYFLRGVGQVWRMKDGNEDVVDVEPGVSITIPLGTHFQFQNLGEDPLEFLIVTMPPWPGEDEAFYVDGKWMS